MSTWLAVFLSGRVFPSAIARDRDLVSNHPPSIREEEEDDGSWEAADGASDPAEATAEATLALIACAARGRRRQDVRGQAGEDWEGDARQPFLPRRAV
jgi:hypothetical protein